jgi:hypothetical protein
LPEFSVSRLAQLFFRLRRALPLLAFIAGLIAIGVRATLLAGGILREAANR